MKDKAFDVERLEVPELSPTCEARVLRLARAELAPEAKEVARGSERLKLQLRTALVPVLLLSAGGCRTALTLKEIATAYPETPGKTVP